MSGTWQWVGIIAVLFALCGCGRIAADQPGAAPASTIAGGQGEAIMHISGIPEGWDAYEQTQLRSGDWRFFYIVDRLRRSSVREDNLVLKGEQVMSGADGLAMFLAEHRLREHPDAIPPARLAAQAGMFLIHGDSRQSCQVRVLEDVTRDAPQYERQRDKLHAPATKLEGDRLVHRSWLVRDGYLQHLVVRMAPDGTVNVDLSELLTKESL